MIHLITRDNIEGFDKMVPGLERALTKTTLGKSWDIQSLYDSLVNLQAFAFHQVESQYSGVFTISEAPLIKSLYWFWSGKEPSNKTPIDFSEVDAFLTAAARYFQCGQIIGEGRKGWAKVSAPFGYTEDSVICIKEVRYELPEIQPTAPDGGESTTG